MQLLSMFDVQDKQVVAICPPKETVAFKLLCHGDVQRKLEVSLGSVARNGSICSIASSDFLT